jgi:hypothetical protein
LQEKEKSYVVAAVFNGLGSSSLIHSLHLSFSTFCFYLSLNFRKKIKRESKNIKKRARETEREYQARDGDNCGR